MSMFVLVKPPYPMLARVGKMATLADACSQGYIVEPKIDGIRCLAVIGEVGGERVVRLWNRQLVDITARFPDVVDSLKLYVTQGEYTLDGEIYVRGPDGEADFQLVQHRANRLHGVGESMLSYPAQYAAFDLLYTDGRSVMHWRLGDRRHVLEEVAGQLVVADYAQDEVDHLALTQTGEGLMLKLRGARYLAGQRAPSWLKVKWPHEVECVVGGVTHGLGRRANTFGGLLVGVYKPGDAHGTSRLTYIGCVGTGFTDGTLGYLTALLRDIRTATCPFVERGSDWDLAYFVRPVLKIRVQFADYTNGGILRHPRYVGME